MVTLTLNPQPRLTLTSRAHPLTLSHPLPGGNGFINFAGGESDAEKSNMLKGGKKGVGFREVEMFL